MSWWSTNVGRGRKLLPFRNDTPAYVAFWRQTLDKTRRLLTQPPTATLADLQPTPTAVEQLGGLPNFDLYREFMRDVERGPNRLQTALMLVFAFAVPFRDVAKDAVLLRTAVSIVNPQQRELDWSMPLGNVSVYYRALEMRLAYLNNLLDIVRARKAAAETDGAQSASDAARIENKVTLWRNGHIMLTLALEELGHVPSDEKIWDVLLERYSPDVNMFLHAGDLPDLRDELHATPFLREPSSAQSTQNKIRAANAVLLAFTKVCPRRCGMRDLIDIMLEYAVRNVATLHFLMLVMAASQLGLYAFCNRRPDWRMTRDVYRLFFFELDERLRAHRQHTQSEQDRLYARFAIAERDVSTATNRENPRVVFGDYVDAVRTQYKAALDKAGKASADGVKQKAKRVRASTADSGGRSTARQRAEAVVATIATTTTAQSSDSKSAPIVIDDDETELQSALALANATARLEFDRNLGREYYEQRAAAGLLPTVDGVVQEFVAPDVSVTDIYAVRRIASCDRRALSPVELMRRRIIYRFLSTLITYDNPRPNDQARFHAPSKEFPFTSALTQHIREFMFHLLEIDKPLLDELTARVQWRPWQRSVVANSDMLRARLSLVATQHGVPFTRQHRVFLAVSQDKDAPTNNLYKTENEPFTGPLLKAMTSYLQTPRCMTTTPVDYVVPREYYILMCELLRFWNYRYSYQDSALTPEFDELASTTTTADDDAAIQTTSTAPYIETTSPPLAPFGYALTKAVPADDATDEWIDENIVRRLHFPGRLFHMTAATIDAYNSCYRSYAHDEDVDKLLFTFAKNLATTSMFQFMLVLTFAQAVETHLSVMVLPLPAHIVQQQMRVMCARYRCIDPARVPRHAHYSLVCLSCKRYAGFVATAKRPNVCQAEGTLDVRTLVSTDDIAVLDRVRRRGGLLAPNELDGAESMYKVFEHRALHGAVYDKYVRDPLDRDGELERRARGDYNAYDRREPWNPRTPADELTTVQRLYAAAMQRRATAPPTLPDPRTTSTLYAIDADGCVVPPSIADGALPRGSLPPMRAVATDGQLESELLFNRQVRNLYDKLMGGNHFLYGHRLPTIDNRPYLASADSRENTRHEFKKRKTNTTVKTRIDNNPNSIERKRDLERWQKRECRDVMSLCQRVNCSNELMFQFSRIGSALVINQRGRSKRSLEIIIDCCSCGTSVLFSTTVVRGDFYICPVCIANNSWIQWFGGGEQSLVTLATVDMLAMSDVASRLTPSARLMSPGQSWLPDACVRQNEKCVYPNCLKQKQADTQMTYKEVVFDTPGKECIGYVAVCQQHIREYEWLLTFPFMMTRSMIGVLLHRGMKQVSIEELQNTDYLKIYMTLLGDVSNSRSVASGAASKKRTSQALELDGFPSV